MYVLKYIIIIYNTYKYCAILCPPIFYILCDKILYILCTLLYTKSSCHVPYLISETIFTNSEEIKINVKPLIVKNECKKNKKLKKILSACYARFRKFKNKSLFISHRAWINGTYRVSIYYYIQGVAINIAQIKCIQTSSI